METFPDSVESTAADALLHLLLEYTLSSSSSSSSLYLLPLSVNPSPYPDLPRSSDGEDDQNSSSITSSSSSSTTTINTGSSGDVSRRVEDPLLLLQFAAQHQLVYESKFQSMIRRRRTKVYFVAARPEPSHSKGTASTVSTASVSSPRGPARDIDLSPAKKPVGVKMGSKRVQRAAGDISKLLAGGGTFSEFQIREALGDSPDTSKALRLLLKLHEVKRSGDGGKSNPYTYEIASQCNGADSGA